MASRRATSWVTERLDSQNLVVREDDLVERDRRQWQDAPRMEAPEGPVSPIEAMLFNASDI
jgi:hypothetical protein